MGTNDGETGRLNVGFINCKRVEIKRSGFEVSNGFDVLGLAKTFFRRIR